MAVLRYKLYTLGQKEQIKPTDSLGYNHIAHGWTLHLKLNKIALFCDQVKNLRTTKEHYT